MADWRLNKGPASFRGVRFEIVSAEIAGGRNTVLHSFPFSELPPQSEDMGAKGRSFTLDVVIVGDNYEVDRDQLMNALEVSGPGELVHPYFGSNRTVSVLTYRVRQDGEREGGVARFSIEFEETDLEELAPLAVINSAQSVAAAADGARSSISEQFLLVYQKLAVVRSSITGAIRSAQNAVNGVLEVVTLEAQDLANISRQLIDVGNSVNALSQAPDLLLRAQLDVFDSLGTALATASSALSPSGVFLKLYGFLPGSRPPGTTPSRVAEQVNFDAFQALIQRLSLISAAEQIVAQTFAAVEDAIAARNAVVDLIDQHLEAVTDDTFDALMNLRVAVVQAVPLPSVDLPRLQTYTPPVTLPSLVLAKRLYGDLSLEQDLIDRNRIRNPGFVPGAVPLQVLTHE